ncbi:MAG: N-6 DNA methylase [Lachnospiraceae bacterium]|nr:N-6 DNA methylase [Lachnospiraceae bacterium]
MLAIWHELIKKDKVEVVIILQRELFIITDISVTLWILNQNKQGGEVVSQKKYSQFRK